VSVKLSPRVEYELKLLQRAARNPKLKVAIAAYDLLRRRGVPHREAIRQAAEFADINFDRGKEGSAN
jgi:hypothetical protein